MNKYLSLLSLYVMLISWNHSVQANELQPFISSMRAKAQAEGIDNALLDKVFHGFKVNKKAVAADKNQPEDKLRFTKYRQNIVSDYRVKRGHALYRKHRALLEKVAAEYGVPAKYIVALWGTETAFGSFTGGHNVPRALATLAYEGRRKELFTKEFLTSLAIIQDGHITYENMKGSWAGAMGQCQFMPSSFMNFAVDYDGDGHRDIWNTLPDVFASIANYLKQSGWKDDERWGRQVRLPKGFDVSQEDINGFFPLSHWKRQGITYLDGTPLPDVDLQAAFMLPGAVEEGAYLVYPNYHVLLKWNFSRFFGTAVGLLADDIGRGV